MLDKMIPLAMVRPREDIMLLLLKHEAPMGAKLQLHYSELEAKVSILFKHEELDSLHNFFSHLINHMESDKKLPKHLNLTRYGKIGEVMHSTNLSAIAKIDAYSITVEHAGNKLWYDVDWNKNSRTELMKFRDEIANLKNGIS